jgi:hypothetical protein
MPRRDPLARPNEPREHAAAARAAHDLAHGGPAIFSSIRCFMPRHLCLARRLHLGARRRGRCRSGPIFCRGRVRYVPSVQCTPPPPARLPRPVRRHPLRRPRVRLVGQAMRLSPTLPRALCAARSDRCARPAEDQHPLAPTTPTETPVHSPLLLGAAGRAPRTAARFHTAARVHAPPRRSGGQTRAFTFSMPVIYACAAHAAEHCARGRSDEPRGLPQVLHRRSQVFSLPPSTPPRSTCTGPSCSSHLIHRYDDDDLKISSDGERAPPIDIVTASAGDDDVVGSDRRDFVGIRRYLAIVDTRGAGCCSWTDVGLPGYWAVLFALAAVRDPAGSDASSPMTVAPMLPKDRSEAFGTQVGQRFRG